MLNCSVIFGNAPILYIEGKMYPVSQFYLDAESEDIVDTMIRSIIQINLNEPEGIFFASYLGKKKLIIV